MRKKGRKKGLKAKKTVQSNAFEYKAKIIRQRLGRFELFGVLSVLHARLHDQTPIDIEARRMPWVTNLAMEWAFEVCRAGSGKQANHDSILIILNQIHSLSTEAFGFNEGHNIQLALRASLINQLRFQRSPAFHLRFLTRLFHLFKSSPNAATLAKKFENESGISIEAFCEMTIFFFLVFSNAQGGFIDYETIVRMLVPKYSLKEVEAYIHLVGRTPLTIQRDIRRLRRQDRVLRRSEYNQPPFLLQKPIIIVPNGISCPHITTVSQGLCEFFARYLKEKNIDAFRRHFTKAFEQYINDFLNHYDIRFITEETIKGLMKANAIEEEGQRISDFVIEEDSYSIFIEVKGIEPKDRLLTSENSEQIRRDLNGSLISGIDQVEQTAKLLIRLKHESLSQKENRFTIVVTHTDMYFMHSEQLFNRGIDEVEEKIKKVGGDAVPLNNIFFCSAQELEDLLLLCEKSGSTIGSFLSECSQSQNSPETRRFDMAQFINEHYKKCKIDEVKVLEPTRKLHKEYHAIFQKLVDEGQKNEMWWAAPERKHIASVMLAQLAAKLKSSFNED